MLLILLTRIFLPRIVLNNDKYLCHLLPLDIFPHLYIVDYLYMINLIMFFFRLNIEISFMFVWLKDKLTILTSSAWPASWTITLYACSITDLLTYTTIITNIGRACSSRIWCCWNWCKSIHSYIRNITYSSNIWSFL
jgi:hypothetical protein